MKRKLLTLILFIGAILCCTLALSACGGDNNEPHVHEWGEWVVTEAPTCIKGGKETRTCKLDPSHVETRDTWDSTAHKLIHHEAQAATCSAGGWNAYDECEYCDYSTQYSQLIEIDPDAHDFDGGDKCKICGTASNYTRGLDFSYTEGSTEYSVWVSGDNTLKNETDIVIPCSYKGLPVTTISSYAFNLCLNLTNVILPDSITNIEDKAFASCKKLKNMTFGKNVASLGENIFESCYELESIEVDENNASFSSDEEGILYNKNKTAILKVPQAKTEVNIPSSVTTIGAYAFGESRIWTITIPESITTLAPNSFADCVKLVQVINMSELEIEKGYDISGISDCAVEVLNSDTQTQTKIKDNGDYKFYIDGEYDGENEKILLGYNGTDTELNLPSDGRPYKINSYAFSDNSGITKITINNATEIKNGAFARCSKLEEVSIPQTVTLISVSAFDDCISLKNISVSDSNSNFSSQDGILFNKNKTEIIRVPQTKTEVNIPSTVTTIGRYAFEDCTALTSITIPSSVTTIDDYAFEDCTNLTSIVFDSNSTLKSIGTAAFYHCDNITSIDIPQSVTSIRGWAFCCNKLKNITIGDNVTYIGQDTFTGTAYFSDLGNWHNNALYLENYLLTVADLTDSYTIAVGTKLIAESAFYGRRLKSVIIPDSVTTICERAFYGCTNLTSVTIGNGVNSIGSWAFYECISLTSATFQNTQGWKVEAPVSDALHITLGTPEENAIYLTQTYLDYSWIREN